MLRSYTKELLPALRCPDVRERNRAEDPSTGPAVAYLHALDGLISVPHRADLVVHGLVRQQQLVEDLQRTGPVPDRLQRHDPCEMRLNVFRERWRRCVTGSVGPLRVRWRRGALKALRFVNHESRITRCGRLHGSRGKSAPITEPRVRSGRKPRPLTTPTPVSHPMKPFIILMTTATQQ